MIGDSNSAPPGRSRRRPPTPLHTLTVHTLGRMRTTNTMLEPENPTLGRFFIFLRQREEQRRHDAGTLPRNRKLSREKAAGEAHITASYLTKLERDEVGRVDIGILRQLTDTYRANDEEWRYACDLAGYASP